MGLFDDITKVKASLDASYVRPGHYLFLIEAGKLANDRSGIPFVVLEMVCVGVYPDSDGHLPITKEGETQTKGHFPGERASHLIKNGGNGKDMFLPNIKAMIKGVMGIDESEVTPDMVGQVFVPPGGESAWRGLVVEVEARNRVTAANKNFTRISYRRMVGPEEYEALGVQLPAEWQTDA